jgi:hypothetical protein|tara:strand:+ start:177 stop:590 length:414 start_codon:yes stop_codon:yes gene_type:complete
MARHYNPEKLYQLFAPTLEECREKRQEFGRAEIRFARTYGSAGQYYDSLGADVVFQCDVQPGDCTTPGQWYAGKVKCGLRNAHQIAGVINRAMKAAATIAPHEPDELESLVIGLRANGYRRVHLRTNAPGLEIARID